MDHYFALIEGVLAAYGLAAVFLLGVLEEILFFVPTPFFFVGVGFFMIDGHLKLGSAINVAFLQIALPATIGVVLGGLGVYWLVYFGGRSLVRKLGNYIGLSLEDLDNLNRKFKKGHVDEVALVLLRAVPLVPISIVSLFCGLIRLSLIEFVWTTFVGTTMRLMGLALLGWYLGREYIKYAEQVAVIERYAVVLAIILGVIGLIYLHGKQSKQN